MANTFLKFSQSALQLDQNGADQNASDNSIPGESQDQNLPQWIEIGSWSWGESNPGTWGTGGGGGGSQLGFQDLSFSAPVSSASTAVMLACANGQHFPFASLVCRKVGGAGQPYVYLQIGLANVTVSGYQGGGSDGDGSAMDMYSLNYQVIQAQYFTQDVSGNVAASAPSFYYDRSKKTTQPTGSS
jgi:type VI secretion system secreted protein Hcp